MDRDQVRLALAQLHREGAWVPNAATEKAGIVDLAKYPMLSARTIALVLIAECLSECTGIGGKK